MDFWKELLGRYPKIAVYALIVYAIGYSSITAYETYRKNVYEAKKPYVDGILQQCQTVTELVGTIVADELYSEDNVKKFLALYYGKLVLFENKNLSDKMIAFKLLLVRIDRNRFVCERIKLFPSALDVAGACRDLIKATWDLSLQPWGDLEASKKLSIEPPPNPKGSSGGSAAPPANC